MRRTGDGARPRRLGTGRVGRFRRGERLAAALAGRSAGDDAGAERARGRQGHRRLDLRRRCGDRDDVHQHAEGERHRRRDRADRERGARDRARAGREPRRRRVRRLRLVAESGSPRPAKRPRRRPRSPDGSFGAPRIVATGATSICGVAALLLADGSPLYATNGADCEGLGIFHGAAGVGDADTIQYAPDDQATDRPWRATAAATCGSPGTRASRESSCAGSTPRPGRRSGRRSWRRTRSRRRPSGRCPASSRFTLVCNPAAAGCRVRLQGAPRVAHRQLDARRRAAARARDRRRGDRARCRLGRLSQRRQALGGLDREPELRSAVAALRPDRRDGPARHDPPRSDPWRGGPDAAVAAAGRRRACWCSHASRRRLRQTATHACSSGPTTSRTGEPAGRVRRAGCGAVRKGAE